MKTSKCNGICIRPWQPLVAHHWELADKLDNDGFEFIAESIR